jgi:hypothetical protein
MKTALTIYSATRISAVIVNASRGCRMSWLQVKGLYSTGQQEKTI